ncbi:MAG: [protein-PII] uridylyltransferase [Deltaproteobacteria bacterium]|nr:[protein-PII] uridylyltransferase [Deltaproteobacteria bacterium]
MQSAFEELRESREALLSRFSSGDIRVSFQDDHTEIFDQYFRKSLQESRIGQELFKKEHPFALVAVGGYGRKELCIHSDIDIMVLFGPKVPLLAKEFVDEIFFPLWDLGLDLGYAVRSIKDCLSLCKDDYQVLSSMLDARFICGDSPVILTLMDQLFQNLTTRKAASFAGWLEDQNRIRTDVFGDSSYLLEPNLKEGIGGLRDYHHILWLSKSLFGLKAPRDLEYTGILSHNEYQDLEDWLGFIWLVRNHLHKLSGRKNDRLTLEYQEDIALKLGFKNQKSVLAVEQFMGRLHAFMGSVKSLHNSFVNAHIRDVNRVKKSRPTPEVSKGLHLYHGEINFHSATAILANPLLLMEIFASSARHKFPLSLEAKRLVREFLYLVDDRFRESSEAVRGFLDIMNDKDSFETLNQMFETGFLDAFIPEFGRIKNRVEFDTYHIFPVGRHLLETVRYLMGRGARKEILLLDIAHEIPHPERLYLAGILHDIGKTGKDHARKGVNIARKILKRFNYDEEGIEDILFLVKYHLLLAETATRRDLNDEKVIVQCARVIGDAERLKMLYLLTVADSSATSPGVWNEWTANLVQELFFKVLHVLEKGDLATADASKETKKKKSAFFRYVTDMDQHDLEYFFEVMSPRYILNTPPKRMAAHLAMLKSLGKEWKNPQSTTFSIDAREDKAQSCWEITFLAKDRPKLFSDMAGAMALNNINVLSADIYTWRDGTALDIFRVTGPLDTIHPQETWDRLTRDLKNALSDRSSLALRLKKKATPSILSNTRTPKRPPNVVVDNDSSDFFTLIEVFSDDRLGLLYIITHALSTLGLDIRIAKIATKGDQIADVFYVRDLEGQKVQDKNQIEAIREELLHQLSQPSAFTSR